MTGNIVALLPVLCQVDVLSKPVEEPADADRRVIVLQARLDALQIQVFYSSSCILLQIKAVYKVLL